MFVAWLWRLVMVNDIVIAYDGYDWDVREGRYHCFDCLPHGVFHQFPVVLSRSDIGCESMPAHVTNEENCV